MDAQTLIPKAWTLEAVNAFEPVCAVNPFGVLQSASELVEGSYLFEYQHGDQVALIALNRDVFSGGIRVHLQALVNLTPDLPLQYRHTMQAVENTARIWGADILTLCTQHAAMTAAAPRWGGEISGAIITKILRTH
jgi:hypothetical protein